MFNWVLISKLTDLIGYTPQAARAKIKRGVWRKDVHWKKAPDGRILFNLMAIKEWIEGKG